MLLRHYFLAMTSYNITKCLEVHLLVSLLLYAKSWILSCSNSAMLLNRTGKKGLNKNTGNGKYKLLCKAFVFNTYKFSRFVSLENVSFDMVLMRLLCRDLRKVTQKVCQ